MRNKAKQIALLAVLAALTVAGMSVAAGGGGGSKDDSSTESEPATTFAVNGEGKGERKRGHLELRADFADEDVRAVLEDIRDAVGKQAPEIAGPVIEKAENDNKINSAQADALRKAAADIAAGKRPDIRSLPRDEDVHRVIKEAFAAAHEKTPGIAEPIIDKAVSDDKITEAQADRIREMVKRGPGIGFGHHRDGPHFGGKRGIDDKDMRTVFEDVHEAVAKQAPDIAGPVIDKAEKDGKITAAQADDLRDAAGGKLPGKPGSGPPPKPDLRDADVREVLEDSFDAIAKKRSEIAKPIIDKAVADKKITEAQADRLRSMLNRHKGPVFHLHVGPGDRPHFEGKGGKGHFGPGTPPPPPEPGSSVMPEPVAPGSPA